VTITVAANLNTVSVDAWELGARYPLRSELTFAAMRTVKPSPTTHRSDTYKFSFFNDITANTTPLTETTDVTPDNISDNQVTVTIAEYGQASGITRWAKATGMLDYDPALANIVGRAAGVAYDTLARTALLAGTVVKYAGTGNAATADVADGDNFTAALVRRCVGTLATANAAPYADGKYLAIVHPWQSMDLREQTGDAAWLAPAIRQDKAKIENGHIGSFGGATFVESNRVYSAADGTTSEPVYRALFLGEEALACAYASNTCGEMPHIEIAPVVDKLNRFAHVGWYWVGGFKILRDAAVVRAESAVSV
jgi:N4-gp56 family major capsid protein